MDIDVKKNGNSSDIANDNPVEMRFDVQGTDDDSMSKNACI